MNAACGCGRASRWTTASPQTPRSTSTSTITAAGPARFVAPADDDYCLMWENRGSAPVRLEGRLEHAG
jgi:hypothetical protein